MIRINVLEYLEHSAQLHGEKPAFVDEGRSISFSGLVSAARAMGSAIAALGLRRRPIAVLCAREAEATVGMMAALFSGNFYIPIDPQTPAPRLEPIMAQAQPAAVIYTAKTRRYLAPWEGIPAFCVGGSYEEDPGLLEEIRREAIDTDPCYMIFTSGSTGAPKGVAVSHRSVIDFVEWYCDTCGIVTEDILGNQAPFFFDLSVKNLYGGIFRGCTVHVLPKKFFSFHGLLMDYIEKQGISVLSWATSAFRMVASSGILESRAPKCIRLVIVGGEALHGKTLNCWRAALPDTEYINLYGPTEVTVDCTYFKITKPYADSDMIPIGKACRNKRVCLLEDRSRAVKPGEPGEICVCGSGVALGYYGDWEKTADAFIQNPLNPHYREIMYCTGDIGVENAEGDIVYLSRRDGQIKHMGYRIELGEVEAAIGSIPGVEECVCLFDKTSDEIICLSQGSAGERELAIAAGGLLPKYMLPGKYIIKERMPMSPNGKIDRAALRKELGL